MLSARRASPSAARAMSSSASGWAESCSRPSPRSRSASAAFEQRGEILDRERPQHVHAGARQQRAHHLERRVLGGRADEGERAVLEVRQEGVLLRLVEAVHLVQEQQRRPPVRRARGARRLDRRADVLDAGHDGRQRDELRVGGGRDQARERRLAGARRSPEDQGVQLPGADRGGERLAGTQQVALADELLERARAHAVREWAKQPLRGPSGALIRGPIARECSLDGRADDIGAGGRREAHLSRASPGRCARPSRR